MTDEIERLLGGYATNTLSDEERERLFAAAVEDQEVFDALENEQVLRDLLDDSVSRGLIEKALATPLARPVRRWSWFWYPAAGVAAAGSLVLAFVMFRTGPPPETIAYNKVAPANPATVSAPLVTISPSGPSAAPAGKKKAAIAGRDASPGRGPVPPPLVVTKKAETEAAAPKALEPIPEPALPSPAPAQQQPQQTAALGGAPQDSRKDSDALTQSAGSLQSFRERDAQAKTMPAPAAPMGRTAEFSRSTRAVEPISVAVLRRTPEGEFVPLAPDEALQAGDFIRFEVRTSSAGSLTVSPHGAPEKRGLGKNAISSLSARRASTPAVREVSAVPGQRYLIPEQPIQVTGPQTYTIELTPSSGVPTVRVVLLEPGHPVKP